ncbi:LysR family transcriptional regulator [Salipiger thiooxidans]|uniref:LysR family transcriptional regulator n=1 Tax=Salipiger thiooxidans TaxID=282683 RepID=UPI001CD71022|nr:LysR family transcriptional regulator [Salipiger thiooxidans]MCA0850145.1 LysR family transcriptional regulator [Salipiger thiooxidans]
MRHLSTLMMIRDAALSGSIRRAAEDMNLTSSALNRRIQSFEEDFGVPIFERLPRGVRLNPAGELLMQHIQAQAGDLARVGSLIADLSGERCSHVTIACSQALNPVVLPREVARDREEHPGVAFSIRIRDRARAEREVSTFAADPALAFKPVHVVDFEVIEGTEQPVCAVLAETHALAGREVLRLRDCLAGLNVIPSPEYGVRHLLEQATKVRSMSLRPVVEDDSFDLMRQCVLHEQVVGFQIPIGIPATPDSAP